MLNIKENIFGSYTDEEINKYLNSKEYMWYKNGAKEGIWIGLFVGFWTGILVMTVIVMLGFFK